VTNPAGRSPAGKGRPTPKRSEKAPRRGGPVTPPPLTRREAAKRQKEQAAAARKQFREGNARGDERYLAKRDAGPVRAMVRDLVDGRVNVGIVLLPLALTLVVINLTDNRTLQGIGISVWLVALLASALDLLLTGFTIRRRVRAQFPDEARTRGHVAYGLLRSTVLRRFRLPPPRVSPLKRRTT
jgi:hypothetical protein